jgi:hypothetical protein
MDMNSKEALRHNDQEKSYEMPATKAAIWSV